MQHSALFVLKHTLRKVSNLEATYISISYTNWKDACVKFQNHKASAHHKDVVLKTITLHATTDIDECLSLQVAK